MGILNRVKAFGNNTKQGINNAWVGGDRSRGFGARDVLGMGVAGGVAGPVGQGAYTANKLSKNGSVNSSGAGYGADGAPPYSTPPSYVTEGGTTAQAAQMQDNSGAWQRMAEDKQRQEESMQMDKQARLSNAGAASARAGLAMRGGLKGGAGERIAAKANEDALMANQTTMATGAGDRLGIGMKAYDMSTDIGKTNAGFTQQANITNAGNMMNREQGRNNNLFGVYQEDMKQKGARYAADSAERIGKRPTLLSDPLGYAKQYV